MAAQDGMTRKRAAGETTPSPSGKSEGEPTAESRVEVVSRAWATVARALRTLNVEEQQRVIEAAAVLLGMKVVKE